MCAKLLELAPKAPCPSPTPAEAAQPRRTSRQRAESGNQSLPTTVWEKGFRLKVHSGLSPEICSPSRAGKKELY